MSQILKPLKIGASDTSRVAEDVWNDQNILRPHDQISVKSGRSVRSLSNQLSLDRASIGLIDRQLQSSRNENVAFLTEYLLVLNDLRMTLESSILGDELLDLNSIESL